MPTNKAETIVAVLAHPVALLVFSAIVTDTSEDCERARFGYSGGGIRYITTSGLMKSTGLSEEQIETAAARLTDAGLLVAQPDHKRRCTSWRPKADAFRVALESLVLDGRADLREHIRDPDLLLVFDVEVPSAIPLHNAQVRPGQRP